MKKSDIFYISILFVGAIWLLMSPSPARIAKLDAKDMLIEIQKDAYLLSVDDIAKAIINNDPSILLIDLRDAKEYAKFSLPNSVNIPLDSLLTDNWIGYLDQVGMKSILYSNGTSLSTDAWMLTRQLGYKNVYILRGGVNEWISNIIAPKEPETTESKEAIETYNFRLAAKQFFTGVKVENQQNSGSSTAIKVNTSKKKKKAAEGGCS